MELYTIAGNYLQGYNSHYANEYEKIVYFVALTNKCEVYPRDHLRERGSRSHLIRGF